MTEITNEFILALSVLMLTIGALFCVGTIQTVYDKIHVWMGQPAHTEQTNMQPIVNNYNNTITQYSQATSVSEMRQRNLCNPNSLHTTSCFELCDIYYCNGKAMNYERYKTQNCADEGDLDCKEQLKSMNQ